MDSARHFIKRHLNPGFLSQTASYEVASVSFFKRNLNPGFLSQTASYDAAITTSANAI